MCDQDHWDDDLKNYTTGDSVSRRTFGALSIGAGMAAALLPRDAAAQAVTEKDVTIKTPDGTCDAYFVHPAKPAAGVLVWPDILGLRPVFRQMGKRLAESGYAVLVVNPFYRQKPAPVVPEGARFSDPETRKVLFGFAGGLNATTHVSDAKAFVAWLDAQPQVDKTKKIGTTGYCMGGPMVMRTVGTLPDRVGAGASFHGGGLVTKNPDSPHLLIPQMRASLLIAIAENDDQRAPDDKNVLREHFDKAKVPAEIEVYTGAAHGWTVPQSEVYHQAQAEKAWARLLATFGKALA